MSIFLLIYYNKNGHLLIYPLLLNYFFFVNLKASTPATKERRYEASLWLEDRRPKTEGDVGWPMSDVGCPMSEDDRPMLCAFLSLWPKSPEVIPPPRSEDTKRKSLWLEDRRPKTEDRRRCRMLEDRKSTRLNSSHVRISYAVFCLKKKKKEQSD